MKIKFTGIHMELTEGIKEFSNKKIAKLNKFFTEEDEIKLIFETSKEGQKAELLVDAKQGSFIAKVVTEDLYVSIDRAIDDIERQYRKYKDSHEKDIRNIMRQEENEKTAIKDVEDEEEK